MTGTVKISSRADIGAALRASMDQGGLLLDASDLCAEFFDSSSGLAAEVVRKFESHRVRLAVVVADAAQRGPGYSELAYQHRAHPAVRFFSSAQQARQWLSHNPVVRC